MICPFSQNSQFERGAMASTADGGARMWNAFRTHRLTLRQSHSERRLGAFPLLAIGLKGLPRIWGAGQAPRHGQLSLRAGSEIGTAARFGPLYPPQEVLTVPYGA